MSAASRKCAARRMRLRYGKATRRSPSDAVSAELHKTGQTKKSPPKFKTAK